MSLLKPENYAVVWIAPLEIEARAALHMLDERHEGRFPVSRGDDYVFHAGSMCGHNVVIATLPAGQEYGTGSAAALASQVKKFFPDLWFGLLVGVAAGLPDLSRSPAKDIRLGDVLVGLADGESAGLIAYDLGKETRNGFEPLRSGHVLATTEPIVRSAIGSIKLRAPDDADTFLPYYNTIRDKEHSTGTFSEPGQDYDRLYLATGTLVERERRPASRRTRVWYGPIGSGEKLLKNAQKRNILRDKYGLIGLETEAAGTINRIPVGVIRGVCDYGDQHNNKKWQPYAAAMAAAYGKAILNEIPPMPQDEPTVSRDSPLRLQVCQVIGFPPNDGFIQRSAISEQIERLLPSKARYQCAALWGLGGSGKTQLALDYAYRRGNDPTCSVFWVHADSEVSFAKDYAWIAKKLGLPDDLEDEKLLATVRHQIETLPQWVLVLDNADDLALFGVGGMSLTAESSPDLVDYIPRGSVGTVLWTSRDKKIVGSLVGPQRGIHISKMTDNEGKMLFNTIRNPDTTKDESGDVSQLLSELEWFPLAISQAATYMRRTKLSIIEYLSKLQERKKRWKVLKRSEHDRHRRPQASNSVLGTWNISIEYIRHKSEMAYDILNVLAFVDNQNIPYEMIAEVARVKRSDWAANSNSGEDGSGSADDCATDISSSSSNKTSDNEDEDDEEVVLEAVLQLEEFSFLLPRILKGSSRNRVYDMHKLVQEAISYNLHMRKDKTLGEARSAKIAFEITDNCFPLETDRESWDECERYIVHAQRAGEWSHLHGGDAAVSDLLSRTSNYLFDKGRWREREAVDVMIIGLRRRSLGALHRNTIAGRGRLAVTYQQQGRHKEAERIKVEILRQRSEMFGKTHLDTIWSMATLAITYHAQGRYDEAEKIEVEVLKLRQKVLGDRHPDTIRSMSDLAETYHAQGKYNEAEKIKVEVLKLRQKVLGDRHPDTIYSMAGLAVTYHTQGRYNEAEKIQIEVLKLRQGVLGDKHPDTIYSMAGLAVTYHAQGRYNEAEKIKVEVLKLQQEVLGNRHPDTVRSMATLAGTYHAQGRYNEAEKIQIEVLKLQQEVLGDRHPDTIYSMASLAVTYHAQGRYNEAQKIEIEVLKLRQEVLGDRHPDTIYSMSDLAGTYHAQGRYNEAEKIQIEVLKLRQEVLGDRHPDTIRSMENLALIYRAQNRFKETEDIASVIGKLSI